MPNVGAHRKSCFGAGCRVARPGKRLAQARDAQSASPTRKSWKVPPHQARTPRQRKEERDTRDTAEVLSPPRPALAAKDRHMSTKALPRERRGKAQKRLITGDRQKQDRLLDPAHLQCTQIMGGRRCALSPRPLQSPRGNHPM